MKAGKPVWLSVAWQEPDWKSFHNAVVHGDEVSIDFGGGKKYTPTGNSQR